MSHSPNELPEDAVFEDLDAEYVQSVVELNQMLDRGVSWSGHEANCCFLNTGATQFANISAITGLDFLDDGRGLGFVDWDFDGDLDAWTSNRTAPMLRFVRNELPVGNQFLAIKLQGVTCNRDAINARVEIRLRDAPNVKLLRTLRAGEGFLGQSSKWLHFGLGKGSQIDQLIVHWPGGESELITGIQPNGHYRIRQGTGEALLWTPPKRTGELQPQESDQESHFVEASSETRTLLTSQIPIPPLSLTSYSGEQIELAANRDGPVLLNLWASWCMPCLKELKEFATHADDLRAAGLEIVAASVDSLGDDRGAALEAQQALLQRLGYSFQAGPADQALASKTELLVNYVYGPNRPLPVPTSLLIDSKGRLAAIYKGRVRVEQLLEDVKNLSLKGESRQRAALPFAGRWIGRPPTLRVLGLAAELAESDLSEDALEYVRANSEAVGRDRQFGEFAAEMTRKLVSEKKYEAALRHLRDANSWAPNSAELKAQLGDILFQQGKFEEAEKHLRDSLALDPDQAGANFQLGNILSRKRDLPGAAKQYRRALAARPDMADAHYQLAAVQFQQGQIEESLLHMEQFVELKPEDVNARVNFGAMLASQRQFEKAEQQLKRAIESEPDNGMAHNNLGRVLQDQSKDAEAVVHFRAAIKSDQSAVQGGLNLARLLATSKDSAVKNASEALNIAKKLVAATKGRRSDALEVLADASLSAGQPEQASKAIEAALRIANGQGNRPLVDSLQRKREQIRQANNASNPDE